MRAKIIDAMQAFLISWVFLVVVFSLMAAFIFFVIQLMLAPIIIFARTGALIMIPFSMDLVYKTIKFVLFSATSVSIILWVSSFVFPEDTKTKKYWWNKEINKKD